MEQQKVIENLVNEINSKALHMRCSKPTTSTLTPALAFWEVVRTDFSSEGKTESKRVTNEGRYMVLKEFVNDKRPYVALIAKLESLPTRVFRRLLWFSNIDFQSYESCLRRLTEEQITSILTTYHELFGEKPKVPSCFTADCKTRLRQKLYHRSDTLEDLLNSPSDDYDLRYKNKGAIAYDFFALDMGFNVYTDAYSDTRLEMSKAKQFFSKKFRGNGEYEKKSHENDFTVNQEDGIYFWLYQTARNLFPWNYGKKVTLKKAVCPGFWYTMGIWILLLLISPTSLILAGTGMFASWSLWYVVPLCILAVFTPMVFFSKLGVYLFTCAVPTIERVLGEIDDAYWEMFWMGIVIMFAGSFLGGVTSAVWVLTYYWNYESILLATYFTAFVWFYAIYKIEKKKWISPTKIPVVGIPTTIFVVGKTLFDFREGILQAAQAVVDFFVANWVLFVSIPVFVLLYTLLLVGLFYYSENKERLVDDEKYYKQSRLVWRVLVTIGVIILLATCAHMAFVVVSIWDTVGVSSYIHIGILFLTGTLFVVGAFTVGEPAGVRTKTKLIKSLKDALGEGGVDGEDLKLVKKLSKNPWLRTRLDSEKLVQEIVLFAGRVFDDGHAYPKVLYSITEKGYARMEEYRYHIEFVLTQVNRDHALKLVRYMCDGVPCEDAEREIMAREKTWEERIAKITFWYNATLGRFVVRPVVSVVSFVWKISCDAWQFIFSDICPFIAPSKRIE
jgi:hypothetical protein